MTTSLKLQKLLTLLEAHMHVCKANFTQNSGMTWISLWSFA